MVGQDVHLLDDTVFNNITLGDITLTTEDVVKVAKVAEANSFIMGLEDQYHTIIGEKGARLSGGQKQRIAIARALIRKSPLLILDEATSALDERTEGRIMRNMLDDLSDQIVIIISHRMTTLEYADEILHIRNNRIERCEIHA
jgi:ABC-type bacteriocin/lantibiotic exporter with double-glycine peptidase domain